MADKKPFLETGFGQFVKKASKVVPALAGAAFQAYTNPAGVVGVVADILDLQSDDSPELVKLKQEFEIKRLGFEKEMAEMRLKDVHSARQREISLRNTIGVYTQNIAAGTVILAFVALLFTLVLMERDMAERTSTLVNILLGSLGTVVIQIFSYWFGAADDKGKGDFENAAKELQKGFGT